MDAGHTNVNRQPLGWHIERCEPWFQREYKDIKEEWEKALQDGLHGQTLPRELAELQIPYHNSIVQILRDALDASGGEYSLFQELVMNEIDLIAENIVEMHSVVRQARQAVIDARRRTQDVQMFQYCEECSLSAGVVGVAVLENVNHFWRCTLFPFLRARGTYLNFSS